MEQPKLMPVKRRAVSALVLAETISVLGTRMTYLALPWFVLVTTGSTRPDQIETFPFRPTRVVDSVADLVPLVHQAIRR